jgi:hypothetical protein
VAWLVEEPGHEEFGKIIACSEATSVAPSQSAPIVPSPLPRSTDPPSLTGISDNMPVAEARISWVTLSASISTKGSSRLIGSPARLNHLPTDSLMSDFRAVGTRISAMGLILYERDPKPSRSTTITPKRNRESWHGSPRPTIGVRAEKDIIGVEPRHLLATEEVQSPRVRCSRGVVRAYLGSFERYRAQGIAPCAIKSSRSIDSFYK